MKSVGKKLSIFSGTLKKYLLLLLDNARQLFKNCGPSALTKIDKSVKITLDLSNLTKK